MRFLSQEHKTNTCFFYGSRQTCNAGSVFKQAFTLLELLVVIAIIAIFCRHAIADVKQGRTKSSFDAMFKQLQTVWFGLDDVCGR